MTILLMLPVHNVIHAQELNIENLPAQSLMLINGDNGQVLFHKNSEELVEIGSLTKLLLLYLVFEQVSMGNLALDEMVPISNYAYELSQDYDIPNVPLRQDFQYTVEELITAVAVKNANGAALALREKIALTESDFIKLMEEKLKQWQMTAFQFEDALGLPSDYGENKEEYTGKTNKMSAQVLATIAYRLMNDFPQYFEYASLKQLNFKANSEDPFKTDSNNSLLSDTSLNVNGLFIGYAPVNGYSQVITNVEDETTYLAIAIGIDESQEDPYYPVEQLVQFGKSNFTTKVIVKKDALTEQIPVINVDGGKREVVSSVYSDTFVLSIPKGDSLLKIDYQYIPNVKRVGYQQYILAPIQKGDVLGTVKMNFNQYIVQYLPTAKINEVEVIANESVPEKSFFGKIVQSFLRIMTNAVEEIRKFFTTLFN